MTNSRWLVNLAGYNISRFILEKWYVPRLLGQSYIKTDDKGKSPGADRTLGSWLKEMAGEYSAAYLPGTDREQLAASYLSHFKTRIADDLIFFNMSVKKKHAFFTRQVTVAGRENLIRALASDRGIILLGAHFGSVIRAAMAAIKILSDAMQGGNKRPLYLCSEPVFLNQPGLGLQQTAYNLFYGTDIRFIDTSKSSSRVLREIITALSTGGIVAANMEVISGGSSRLVFPLFAQTAVRLPALAAACFCAFRSRATLLPWFHVKEKNNRSLLTFEPPLLYRENGYTHNSVLAQDYRSLAAILAGLLGKWIRAYPGQWMYWDRIRKMVE